MNAQNQTLEALRVDYATEGLDEARWQELIDLQDELGASWDEGFDLAAAAIDLAHTELAPMSEVLNQRVADQALGYFEAKKPSPSQSAGGSDLLHFPASRPAPKQHSEAQALESKESLPAQRPAEPSTPTAWLPWGAAIAASLLAVLGWAPRVAEQMTGPASTLDGGNLGQVVQVDGDDALAQRRQQLLGGAQQIVQVAWSGTEDPAAQDASGDLVWSTELQEGYMLFNGLPVNNPDEFQYQLWIFDRLQDERYPVDGGVFDVRADDSVVVPISAKLRINEPYLFAVTIEKPGGVVVSSRERLPLLAQL